MIFNAKGAYLPTSVGVVEGDKLAIYTKKKISHMAHISIHRMVSIS